MRRVRSALAIAAAILGLGAAVADVRPIASVTDLAADIDADRDHVSALELAERIKSRDASLAVFDLRSQQEFDEFHIPGAKRATLADLTRGTLPKTSTVVLYSEGGAHSAQAWVLLRMRGYRQVFFLREGLYEWIARVREPRLAVDATPAERAEFARAEPLSRFFGGVPMSDVVRAEVPAGYWTTPVNGDVRENLAAATRQVVANVRRRGC